MSLIIFLQRTKGNKFISFKRSFLAEILGPSAAIGTTGEICGMEFPNGEYCEIFGAEDDDVTSGLGFNHAGENSVQMIWNIADRTQSYIFWPDAVAGRPHLVVTSAEILADLDEGLVKAMGPAVIVKDAVELDRLIYGELK